MDNRYLEMRVDKLEEKVSNLQRDNEGLRQAVLDISTSVEGLCRKISMLEDGLATKTDITHVRKITDDLQMSVNKIASRECNK
ncbi:TPA: hypothetical protein QCU33_005648 [Bacillus cereus]|nr:hypothetical protein [Bacillus cereus]